jgi:hypothetical protein
MTKKSRAISDGHRFRKIDSRVVQGALSFSPVPNKPSSRATEEEAGARVESSDKWTSTPSSSDVSTSSSSSQCSAQTHPFTSKHSYTTNLVGRSSSTAGSHGLLQLLTTPLLRSIPRGYSFLLSLAQGHQAIDPCTQQEQVRTCYSYASPLLFSSIYSHGL